MKKLILTALFISTNTFATVGTPAAVQTVVIATPSPPITAPIPSTVFIRSAGADWSCVISTPSATAISAELQMCADASRLGGK